MEKKELKRISRKELLELLLKQTTRIEELEKELYKTKKSLNDKKISLENTGNIAEASLIITDLFKKTEEACNIYKENIERELRKKYEKLEKKKLSDTEKLCKKKIDLAEKKVEEANNKLLTIKEEIKSIKDKPVKKKIEGREIKRKKDNKG